MPQPLIIPPNLLAGKTKILFISHFAIGDFAYMQSCFRALVEAYPDVRLHLWVDDLGRTRNSARWEGMKKKALYDWLAESPLFEKIYTATYSPASFRASVKEAQNEAYPLVVSLAGLRAPFYARLGRIISPDGFVAGVRKGTKFFQVHHLLAYRKLDAVLPPYQSLKAIHRHVSDHFAGWFRMLFGIDIPPEGRLPYVTIPQVWTEKAAEQLKEWNFGQGGRKLVFVNPFATNAKRSWPLESVAELIAQMQRQPAWTDACFIVNSMPRDVERVTRVLEGRKVTMTRVFTAAHFFTLPAVLSRCDLIISVDTAVVHLGNAVKVPVIALMRSKNPQWQPVDRERSVVVACSRGTQWVKDIPVSQVVSAAASFPPVTSAPAVSAA